jgi:uncharacterized protein
MSGELNAMLSLQDHDSATDQLRHRLATLAERAHLQELTATASKQAARLAELTGEHDSLVARQTAIEREVVASQTKQADLSRKLLATSVSREAQTLQHELDGAKDRQRALEDDELELMEALEPIDAELDQLRRSEADVAAQITVAQAELAVAEQTGARELDALTAARPAVADAVPNALRMRYEALRPRLKGVAVARVVAGHCSGCNLELPTSELQRLRGLPADELAECEQCGRMLVP